MLKYITNHTSYLKVLNPVIVQVERANHSGSQQDLISLGVQNMYICNAKWIFQRVVDISAVYVEYHWNT